MNPMTATKMIDWKQKDEGAWDDGCWYATGKHVRWSAWDCPKDPWKRIVIGVLTPTNTNFVTLEQAHFDTVEEAKAFIDELEQKLYP